MLVKELIEILKKMPQDCEVLTSEEGNAYEIEEKDIIYWNNEDDCKKYGEEFYECVQIG